MYSIVETAKANDVNVYHYLVFLLEKLPTLNGSDEVFEAVCPWNKSVKQEIEERINKSQEYFQQYVNCQGAVADQPQQCLSFDLKVGKFSAYIFDILESKLTVKKSIHIENIQKELTKQND